MGFPQTRKALCRAAYTGAPARGYAVSGNLDDNVPQRVLRDRIAALEQDLGNVLNILHFLITDADSTVKEPLRKKLWMMIDALIAQQNGR